MRAAQDPVCPLCMRCIDPVTLLDLLTREARRVEVDLVGEQHRAPAPPPLNADHDRARRRASSAAIIRQLARGASVYGSRERGESRGRASERAHPRGPRSVSVPVQRIISSTVPLRRRVSRAWRGGGMGQPE